VQTGQQLAGRLLAGAVGVLVLVFGWRQTAALLPAWTWLHAALPLGAALFWLWLMWHRDLDGTGGHEGGVRAPCWAPASRAPGRPPGWALASAGVAAAAETPGLCSPCRSR